jgi:hypothetical protein
MNDGALSLKRLYQNNFRDSFRQRIIDYMLGGQSFDSLIGRDEITSPTEEEINIQEEAIHVTKSILVPGEDSYTYVVVTIESVSLTSLFEIEQILIIATDCLYICIYDYELEKLTQYKKILFKNITRLEKGPLGITKFLKNQDNDYGFAIFYEKEETKEAGMFRTILKDQGGQQYEVFRKSPKDTITSRGNINNILIIQTLQIKLCKKSQSFVVQMKRKIL